MQQLALHLAVRPALGTRGIRKSSSESERGARITPQSIEGRMRSQNHSLFCEVADAKGDRQADQDHVHPET